MPIVDMNGKIPSRYAQKPKSVWADDGKGYPTPEEYFGDQSLESSALDPLGLILGGSVATGALRGLSKGSQALGRKFRESIRNSRYQGNPDKIRRAIDIGALGVAANPKNVARGVGSGAKAVGEGVSMGISSPLSSISKPIEAVSNFANDIAALRHYRMGKVAGDPTASAFGQTYVMGRVEPAIRKMEQYDKMLNADVGVDDLWNYLFPLVREASAAKQLAF